MNDTRKDMLRTINAVRPQLHKGPRAPILTEGQIETAGRTYVRATVWTEAAYLVLDTVRTIGRTLWVLATYAAIAAAAVWTYLNWPTVQRFFTQ